MLRPSHKLPRGPRSRAARRAARRLHLRWRRDALSSLPYILAIVTAFLVTGVPASHGGTGGHVVSVIRTGLIGGVIAAALMLGWLAWQPQAGKLATSQTGRRPRWWFLLFPAGWLGLAGGFAVAGLAVGHGVMSRAYLAFAGWCVIAALAALARAWRGSRHSVSTRSTR